METTIIADHSTIGAYRVAADGSLLGLGAPSYSPTWARGNDPMTDPAAVRRIRLTERLMRPDTLGSPEVVTAFSPDAGSRITIRPRASRPARRPVRTYREVCSLPVDTRDYASPYRVLDDRLYLAVAMATQPSRARRSKPVRPARATATRPRRLLPGDERPDRARIERSIAGTIRIGELD